jgi:Gas vesicle protein G
MGLLTLPFRLPLLPVHAVVRLAQLIQEEAEAQLVDPTSVRHELEQIEQTQAAGEISDAEAVQLQDQAVARFTQVRGGGAAAEDSEG